MASLLEELRRRNVIRVAVAYLVLAWVVLQITDLIAPALHLPDWTMTMVVFLGFVGFPFAIFFAWAFELTPEGLKRSEDVAPSESITGHTASRLNQVTIVMLVLAVAILLLDRQLGLSDRWQSRPHERDIVAQPETPLTAEAEEAPAGQPPRSIAVLPFVNMSGDSEQEYFSDGISEELLNALAQIRELRVAARTSSFAFKGKNQDITHIGEQLNVETVLEGSVRKSGQRVRITAQLINVADGYHLWSNSYDRDLTDIFAVQDEISGSIVSALRVHLTDGQQVARTAPVDLEAYNWVLQARHGVRQRRRDSLELALLQYQKALDIAPDYADAWAGKAMAVLLLRDDQYGDIPASKAAQQAQAYLDRAFALSPELSVAHGAQALLYQTLEQNEKALASIDRAIAANPSEGVWFMWKSQSLNSLGKIPEARQALRKAYETDPLHTAIRINYMQMLVEEKEFAKARALAVPGTSQYYDIETSIALEQGEWARAWQLFDAWEQAIPESSFRRDRRRESLQVMYLGDTHVPFNDGMHPMLKVLLEPQRIIETYQSEDPLQVVGEARHMYTAALSVLGQCEDILAFLEPYALADREDYGLASDGHSPFAMAELEAECLMVTGQRARAKAIAGRLLEIMDGQLLPEQDDFVPQLKALLHYLAGDSKAAAELLGQLQQRGVLRWTFFSYSPATRLFEQDPALRDLKQGVAARLNAERAKLGWEPMEF